MNDGQTEKLFNTFAHYEGYELYCKVSNVIDFEIKQTVADQLRERAKFQKLMMNKINNAGWDNGKTHTILLNYLRLEATEIDKMAIDYGLDGEDYL